MKDFGAKAASFLRRRLVRNGAPADHHVAAETQRLIEGPDEVAQDSLPLQAFFTVAAYEIDGGLSPETPRRAAAVFVPAARWTRRRLSINWPF